MWYMVSYIDTHTYYNNKVQRNIKFRLVFAAVAGNWRWWFWRVDIKSSVLRCIMDINFMQNKKMLDDDGVINLYRYNDKKRKMRNHHDSETLKINSWCRHLSNKNWPVIIARVGIPRRGRCNKSFVLQLK